MATQEEQRRESAEHAQMDEKKAGRRGIDGYVENPEMERRITLKCDLHILPWIFVLWLLAFIDRSNIGQSPFSPWIACRTS
jgi:hypothetical protein